MTWTRDAALEAGRRVAEALGRWPTSREWRELAREAAEAGEPLPTPWHISRLFGGHVAFGRAVGAIKEEPPELPPLSELKPEGRLTRLVMERRIPHPTPPGARTYIFSLHQQPVAVVIDLIPPEPAWEFDRVTVIPWGYDGRTRELTRRLSRAEYLKRREQELSELEGLAREMPEFRSRPTPEEIRRRLRERGMLEKVRRAILARKRAERQQRLLGAGLSDQ